MFSIQITFAALFASSAMAQVMIVQNPPVHESVPAPAKAVFQDPKVKNLLFVKPDKRQVDARDDASGATIPKYIFVVQCTEQGFHGDCLVFGASPGDCVSYADFNTDGKVAAEYTKNVTSISTNTGGVCEWYHNAGCDIDGTDPGVTLSYAYNLDINAPGNTKPDDYSGDYSHNITSWKC